MDINRIIDKLIYLNLYKHGNITISLSMCIFSQFVINDQRQSEINIQGISALGGRGEGFPVYIYIWIQLSQLQTICNILTYTLKM